MLVEVVLAERPAVGDEQRRGVGDPRLRRELHRVLVERHDRIGVLVPRIPVQHLRQVHLEVEPALGRRHQAELLGRHDHPLALLAVPGHVLLDPLGPVELAVAAQGVAGVVQGLEVLVPEDARPRVIDARADELAGLHLIGVGEHVGGGGLRIPGRGHAPGEVREVFPDLGLVDPPRRPRMGVHVDEAGDDRLASDVHHPGAGGHRAAAARAHARDAIVGDHHIPALDDLIPFHRDDAGAPQHEAAARDVARSADRHVHARRVVGGLFLERIHAGPERGVGLPALGAVRLQGVGTHRVDHGLELLGGIGDDRIVAEEAAPDRPVHRLAVRRPADEVASDPRQPLHGKRRRGRIGDIDAGRLAAELRQRHQVDVVPRLRQHAIGVGRDEDLVRGLRLRARPGVGVPGDLEVRAPVGAVEADRDEPLRTGVVEDAVGVAPEMRPPPAIIGRHARGGAAGRRDPVQLIAGTEVLGDARRARPLHEHHLLSVRRPHGNVVERHVRRQPHRRAAAVGADLHEGAAVLRPGDVGDPLAVG